MKVTIDIPDGKYCNTFVHSDYDGRNWERVRCLFCHSGECVYLSERLGTSSGKWLKHLNCPNKEDKG